MPAGRPSKYNDLDLTKVQKLANKGWSDVEMADFFGVDESTWTRWKQKHPDFRTSLKDWKTEADSRVERSLYERAMGYTHKEDKIFNNNGEPLVVPTEKHYPPDATSAIFWLKNRKPDEWRDKKEVDMTVSAHEDWLDKLDD